MKAPSHSPPPAAQGPFRSWWTNPALLSVLGLLALCIAFYAKIVFGIANFWEDLIHQEFPHRVFARDMLLSGQFPHWNPYTFGGMPFFSAIHTGVLYPANLLLSMLPLSLDGFWYALQLVIVLHSFAAGACMFFFAREYTASRAGALMASASYMLCGFFVAHVIHSLMVYILAWMPLVALLLKRGIERGRATHVVAGGIILGLTVLAGHPQVTFYEFLFLGAYGLYLASEQRRRPACLGMTVLMFAVAGGLAMVQLLPATELSAESVRTAWTFEQASEGSMSFRQLFSFVVPKIFGARTYVRDSDPPFWLQDSLQSGYWTYWETAFYTGLPILLLGFVQLVNIRRDRFALACGLWFALSLTVALGNHFPVYRLLFDYVPGFSTFRIPARILFTWNFLLPILAARTLAQLSDPDMRRRLVRPLIGAAGFCLLFGLAVVSGAVKYAWIELEDPALMDYAAKQALIMLLVLALSAAAVTLSYRRKISSVRLQWSMAAVVVLDLFLFGMGQHTQSDESAPQHFRMNRDVSRFLQSQSRAEVFRANVRDIKQPSFMLLRRNQGMIDKIQLLEGYNPLNLSRKMPPGPLPRALDLMNVKYAIRVDPEARSLSLAGNQTYLPRARMFYSVESPGSDSLIRAAMESDTFRYRSTLLLEKSPGIALPADTAGVRNSVTFTRYAPNSMALDVTTSANGVLWLSELFYPAWRAKVDGKETGILRADYVFRAIPLTAGSHHVELRFRSTRFRLGALISVMTLLAAGGWLGWSLRRGGTKPGSA